MEVKKSKQKSLKGSNTLYFLAGLNLVLLFIWGLFSLQQHQSEVPDNEIILGTPTSEVISFELPEESQPPSLDMEEPMLPPPIVPEEIDIVEEFIAPPPIADQDIKTNLIPINNITKPVLDFNIKEFKDRVDNAPKEEREPDPITVNKVTHMAVYPGCETYRGSKRDLVRCFGDKLTQDLIKVLDMEFPKVDQERVMAQLDFHVSTEGEIINIKATKGDDIFKPQAIKALEKVAENLVKSGKRIEPASMENGDKVVLIFKNNIMLANPNY